MGSPAHHHVIYLTRATWPQQVLCKHCTKHTALAGRPRSTVHHGEVIQNKPESQTQVAVDGFTYIWFYVLCWLVLVCVCLCLLVLASAACVGLCSLCWLVLASVGFSWHIIACLGLYWLVFLVLD